MGTILLADVEKATTEFYSLVNIDSDTIVFTLINTLIIVLLYRFFLHKKVCAILDARREKVTAELDAAKAAKEKAEAAEQEYLEKLNESREQAQNIISAAVTKAQARENEIISDAKAQAEQIRIKADENIELEKKRAVNEIKDQISEIVIMAASAVAEKEITEEDNEALINSFLVNIGEQE